MFNNLGPSQGFLILGLLAAALLAWDCAIALVAWHLERRIEKLQKENNKYEKVIEEKRLVVEELTKLTEQTLAQFDKMDNK